MIADIGMGYAIVIAAVVAAVGSVLNTWLTLRVNSAIKLPSGGKIGEAVEKAHHLASVNTGGIKTLIEHVRWNEDTSEERSADAPPLPPIES